MIFQEFLDLLGLLAHLDPQNFVGHPGLPGFVDLQELMIIHGPSKTSGSVKPCEYSTHSPRSSKGFGTSKSSGPGSSGPSASAKSSGCTGSPGSS